MFYMCFSCCTQFTLTFSYGKNFNVLEVCSVNSTAHLSLIYFIYLFCSDQWAILKNKMYLMNNKMFIPGENKTFVG